MEAFVWSLNTNNLFGSTCYTAVTTTFPVFTSYIKLPQLQPKYVEESPRRRAVEKQAPSPTHSESTAELLPAYTLDPTLVLMKSELVIIHLQHTKITQSWKRQQTTTAGSLKALPTFTTAYSGQQCTHKLYFTDQNERKDNMPQLPASA